MSDRLERCPNCGVLLTRWFVVPDIESYGKQTWRVVQLRNGIDTGRTSERLSSIAEAEAVMRALNLFAGDLV